MFAKLLLSVCFLTCVTASIKDCGGGKSLFVINALGFWPDPALKNGNSTISYDYTIPPSLTVTGGTAKYTVTYNFIPLTPTTEDLCTQTTCPLVPGRYNQSTSSTFPDLTGSVTVKTQWFDTNNALLLCTQVSTTAK